LTLIIHPFGLMIGWFHVMVSNQGLNPQEFVKAATVVPVIV